MITMKLVIMILIFTLMIVILLSLLPLPLMRINFLVWRVINFLCLCDSYIVEFIHDATENYYEGGTYACRTCNNIKFPLYVFKFFEVMLVLPSYAS